MRLGKLDDSQGYNRVYEVAMQLIGLEYHCAYLLGAITKLEERCGSVLSHTVVNGKGSSEVPQPPLCPLAARLRRFAHSIELACGDIDMLVERIEL